MNKKESFLTKIKENFSLKGLNPFRLFKVLGKIYGKIRSLLGSDPNKPSVIPVPPSVIPAPSPVIPAEAGIQKARFSYEPYGQIKSGMTKWILSSRGRRLRQSLSGKRTRLLRHSIPHSDEKGSTLFKGVVYRFNLIRLYLMELRYYLHIRFRKVHDKAFARKKTYYRYASKPYSRSINKASVYSFVISFTIFMALQFLSPFNFSGKPQIALAGANTQIWSTYNDFNSGTTQSQVAINDSANPTDANLGNVKLTDAFGTGADCDVTIKSGYSINIATLYQTARSNNALTGVDVDCTSSGGNLYTNAGLGHSSYLSSSTNIPNFKSLTIQSTATLTTTGPSGSNPGVKIEFKVKNTITIESTGKIDASGMGYAGGNKIAATPAYGLGAGGNGGMASGGGGAGYGGAGGNGGLRNSTFGVGGTPYNYQDSVFGSGGGSSTAMFTNIGGNGGGAIKIGANNISVNGSILADGTNGTGYTCGFGCSSGSGGGSGGSIDIVSSGGIDATKLSAKGGNGGDGVITYSAAGGGGGGGGRITLEMSAGLITGSPFVNGGNGGAGPSGNPGSNGSAGNYQRNDHVAFTSPGTLGGIGASDVGLRIDAESALGYTGAKIKPSQVTWNADTTSDGQKVLFKVRVGDTQAELNANQCYGTTALDNGCLDWTTAGTFFSEINETESSHTILNTIPSKRYIEVLVKLDSDGTNTPTLDDVTLTYDSLEAPLNANMYITKTDGTKLKSNSGSTLNSGTDYITGASGGWTSQSAVRVYANSLTCGGGGSGQPACLDSSTNLRPEVEIKLVGSAFTNSGTMATAGNNFVEFTGLTVGSPGYHVQVRATDDEGRVSGWTSLGTNTEAEVDFTIEQTPPTISSFSLNSGAAFAGVSTRIVTASGIYNDLGGSSGSLDIQFSEDGINWGVYHGSGTTNDKATDWEYKTTKNKSGTSQDVANAWYLEGSDGNKTVYVRTRDGAGNVDVDLASDDIILDSTPPVVAADTITSPNGAETWLGGSNHNITWDQTKVTDANLLASPIKLEYSLNNGSTWSLVADTEANDGINAWNPIPSADSNQVKVKLIATDAAGNYTSDESDNIFIIDTVGPNVGTVNALPAYNKNFTFDVPYTATDTASGIDYVKLYFKNTTNHLGWTQFGTTFTSSPISFTADQNDTYKFRLVAVDKVGLKDENDPPTNPAEEALTIVDVVAPVSTITMPEDAATCGSDVGICMYGGPTATYPWPGHITGTVTDNETGISKVEVQITTGSTYYNGTGFVGTPTWVEASITPTGPMSASYNYDIPYSKLSDGNTYTVKVRSTDAAANLETAKTRDFIYDFSAPNSGHFVINNAGDLYAKSLDVTLNFSGADNDVRKAPTYVDANGGLRISNSNDFSSSSWITYDATQPWANWTMAAGADGIRTVYLQWRDRAGNISTVTVSDTITLDTTPATSAILTPANNLKTNSLAEISGTITDTTSGVTNASQIKLSITKDDGGTLVYWSGVMWMGYADINTTFVLQADEILGDKVNGYTYRRNTYLPDDWTQNITKDYMIKVKTVDDATNDGTVATSNITFDFEGPSQPNIYSSSHANSSVWYTVNDVDLTFSSTDSVGVTGYSYTWSLTPTDPDNAEDLDAAGGTLSKNNQADGTWHFKVKAKDEAGNWSASSQFIVRIDTTAPATGDPVFAANGVSDTVIDLSWGAYVDPSSGVKEYKVYRSTIKSTPVSVSTSDPGIDPATLTYTNLVSTESTAKTPATPLHDMALAQGWYYYAIYAYDNAQSTANESLIAYSHSKTNFVPDSITFRVNTLAGPVSVNPSDSKILALTWVTIDPDGAGDIVTTKLTITKPDSTVLTTFDQTDPGMTRNPVSNGYQITVNYTLPSDLAYGNYTFLATTIDTIALNAHTKNSNTVIVKIIPDKPGNVMATGYSSTQIDLVWQAPSYIGTGTQYEIYRSTNSDPSDSAWNTPITTVNVLTYRDETLTADTTYYYKLKTVDGNLNKSAFSDIAERKTPTPAATSTSTVKLIDASSVEAPAENRFVLVWNDPVGGSDTTINGISGYLVEIAEDDVYVRTKETTTKYLVDLNLSSSKKYTYRIRTKDSFGNLSRIAESPVKEGTPGSKPSVAVTSVVVGVSSATIKWTATQESETQVAYSTSKEELKNLNAETDFAGKGGRRLAGIEHRVNITGLQPNTTYYYKIISRNILGFANDFDVDSHSFTTQNFAITHNQSADVEASSSSVTIKWKTTLPSDSLVEYQIVTKKGTVVSNAELSSGGSLIKGGAFKSDPGNNTTNHQVDFSVIPSSKYIYRIVSKTSDGYIAYYPPIGMNEWPSFSTPSDDNSKITVQPDASKIAEENITATSARIVWDTSLFTTSWVDFGLVSKKYTMSAGDNQLNTHHVVDLRNLTPGQLYYYIVRGKDATDLEYVSSEYTFTAVLRPEVTNIKPKSVTSYAATIFWETNVNTDTQIAFGIDENLTQRKGSSETGRSHEITLDNLEDNQQYYYMIMAKDKHGNDTTSNVFQFKTPLDTTGAEVKDIKIDLLPIDQNDGSAGVIISWSTNKPSTKQIEYGEGIGSKYASKTSEDTSFNTGHTVIIKDLIPSTTYHFRIIAKDKRGNLTNSSDLSFVTPAQEKSILQLIIKSLEETFSWVKNIGKLFRR